MWKKAIVGKNDCSSEKDKVFTVLCNECRTIPPGALLSYKLRNTLERFSKEERREIVTRMVDGSAPLFIACQRGNAELAEYLITTCCADVEQRGLFEVADDRSVHHVTPIWAAAVAGKLSVVKLLVTHKADINSVSDTGSTPLRSACFMTHFEVVTYLVENGADIRKPNYNGGTCLINSVQSVELCEYLIKHGADVNAQDIQNKTALHYAIQEHRQETTKLLLKHKANPFLLSKNSDDALQTAGLKGAYHILKCIIEMVDFPPKRVAEAYELLGSTFLDEHHDMQLAINYWRTALNIRIKHNLTKVLPPPCKAFQNEKEFTTMEELDALALDHDAIRIQSLLICQRILGTSHKDMIFRLMYRGAAYGDAMQYQKCINLWLYALRLKIEKDTLIFTDTCFNAQALVRLYLNMLEKFNTGHISANLSFEDAFETIVMISSEIPKSVTMLDTPSTQKRQRNSFDSLLKIFTHLIYIFLQINPTSQQIHDVALILNKIIRLKPRTCSDGLSLLHLSVMKSNVIHNNNLLEEHQESPFPSIEVTRFLLQCGADVNEVTTDKGYSVLFMASLQKNFDSEIVRLLMDWGAHIDQVSLSGESPSNLLASNPQCDISVVTMTTLKCLASRVIRRSAIPYFGEIPAHLEGFVKMH